jgi:dolichyl-phosphate beta-glucosyltransferase
MSKAIIVVPCFNEAERLDAARFRDFRSSGNSVRFLFVNDGSRDGTAAILEELHDFDPGCFLWFSLPTNSGKGEAVRQGLLRALDEGPDYVGYWDADLATPLDAVPSFASVLDHRTDIEMVFGARIGLLGRSVSRTRVRQCLGRMFATAVSCVLGFRVYDMQCGAKLFRASSELKSILQKPFRSRWIFDVELVARIMANRHGSPRPRLEEVIYELPLQEWHDVRGSKLRPADFARAMSELAAIAWNHVPGAAGVIKPGVASVAAPTRRIGVPAPMMSSSEMSRRRAKSGSSRIVARLMH